MFGIGQLSFGNSLTETDVENMVIDTIANGQRYPVYKAGILDKYVYAQKYMGVDEQQWFHVLVSQRSSAGGKGKGNVLSHLQNEKLRFPR